MTRTVRVGAALGSRGADGDVAGHSALHTRSGPPHASPQLSKPAIRGGTSISPWVVEFAMANGRYL